MSYRFTRWFAGRSRPRGKVPPRARSRRTYLNLEQLDERIVPAIYIVNSTADLSIAGGVDPATGRIIGQGNLVTLRSAIEAANATPGGNTINLTIAGVYKISIPPAAPDDTPATENNLTGDFDILPGGGDLTILKNAVGPVTVDGNSLDRVFDINPNFDPAHPTPKFTVTLQGFTIKNGVASPGDGAAGSGGGIRDQGNASLTLNNMIITNCSATADGGAIAMENTVSVPWTLTITRSKIGGNHAGDAGGGVETDGSGTVVINSGTRFIKNTSVNQGGGIWLDAIPVGDVFQSASLAMTGTLIDSNQAGGVGGGIGNAGNGAVTIAGSTVSNNLAGASGAGFGDENNQGRLTVGNSWFQLNEAGGDGGAIAEGGPTTFISTSEFDENFAAGNGGGLFANGRTLTVQNSTFNQNSTDGNGGGIELQTTGAGLLGSTITNTTLADNQATTLGSSNGGGLDAAAAFTGDLRLLNVTINGNLAAKGGGVFWAGTPGSTFSAQNTIIAKNKINGGANSGVDANNPAGTFTDLGGNLIGIAGPRNFNTGFTAATTQTGTRTNPLNPLKGPLQYNGGPTVGAPGYTQSLQTELLLQGSPAIGKGILAGAPATDERGFQSVVNGKINVGAVSEVMIV